MFEGRILMEGTAERLAEDEEARRLYLGTQFKLDRYS
jgi:lipopolysaccharide export system ATP-binding protein